MLCHAFESQRGLKAALDQICIFGNASLKGIVFVFDFAWRFLCGCLKFASNKSEMYFIFSAHLQMQRRTYVKPPAS